ncbi:MAG: Pr6Pr family membrane protein [Sphingomonadaceae bacterium]|nr:Pr6Pr family membrane protein [Sphingomonadaceae bacterium]
MAARIAAGIIALVAMAGLTIQYDATYAQTGSIGATLWTLLRFFTILANIPVALLFGAIMVGRQPNPKLIAGVTLAILLVGIVYGLLLRGLLDLSGGALLADTLLHKVTPVMAPLWWIAFAPKGRLDRTCPWLWAIFPLAYLPYALVRGAIEGTYAYPFINVARLGIGAVMVNAVLIALGFLLAGYALVWLDRRMAR